METSWPQRRQFSTFYLLLPFFIQHFLLNALLSDWFLCCTSIICNLKSVCLIKTTYFYLSVFDCFYVKDRTISWSITRWKEEIFNDTGGIITVRKTCCNVVFAPDYLFEHSCITAQVESGVQAAPPCGGCYQLLFKETLTLSFNSLVEVFSPGSDVK